MNTRTVLASVLLSLLATASGCARPEVSALQAPLPSRPVVAYGLGTDHTARTLSLDQTARVEAVSTPVQKREVNLYSINRSLKTR